MIETYPSFGMTPFLLYRNYYGIEYITFTVLVTAWEITLKYHEKYRTKSGVCTIPKKGYKCITVRDEVYDGFQQLWLKNKPLYVKKGVTSIAGFIAYLLEEELTKRGLITKNGELPRFEHFNMGSSGVRITDRKQRVIADIYFKPQGIYCDHDKTDDCEHIDFALTVPEIKDIVRKHRKEGWKLPDV